MSLDAFLWIATLLFAATMLLLAARRQTKAGEDGADASSDFSGDSGDPLSSRSRSFDLGGGWTLGGDGDRD
jgi:hypothetical protein